MSKYKIRFVGEFLFYLCTVLFVIEIENIVNRFYLLTGKYGAKESTMAAFLYQVFVATTTTNTIYKNNESNKNDLLSDICTHLSYFLENTQWDTNKMEEYIEITIKNIESKNIEIYSHIELCYSNVAKNMQIIQSQQQTHMSTIDIPLTIKALIQTFFELFFVGFLPCATNAYLFDQCALMGKYA